MDKKRVLRIIKNYADIVITVEDIKSSFDAVLKRKRKSYFVKILWNVDGINREESKALTKISSFFKAQPFIIGEISNNGPLEDYVLFKRFSVFTGTTKTFIEYINNKALPVKNASEYYAIDGKRMRKERNKRKLSLQELSHKIGISKETLYRYEKETIFAGKENLKKLEDFFSVKLSKRVEYKNPNNMEKLGDFEGAEVKSPFHYLIKDKDEKFIVGKQKSTPEIMTKYIITFKTISEELDSEYFFITKYRIDAPYLLYDEFKKIGFSEKIKKLLKERM